MATNENIVINSQILDIKHEAENSLIISNSTSESGNKLYKYLFLGTVTGISALIGFGTTLAAVKKKDPKCFEEGALGVAGTHESGVSLALRALKLGTIYAVTGCGLLFYGIWKLSGAENAQEFRKKMGSILPRIPKNNPPQSRTEFEGLTDLLKYISEDWGKEKPKSNK